MKDYRIMIKLPVSHPSVKDATVSFVLTERSEETALLAGTSYLTEVIGLKSYQIAEITVSLCED